MRLDREEEQYHGAAGAAPLSALAREAAHRWLALFSPFLEDLEAKSASECRQRLAGIPALRREGERTLRDLEQHAGAEDQTLLVTLRQAVGELEPLEEDLRRRLGRLAPGDPEGRVDLDAIQRKLAMRAAAEEVAEITGPSASSARLEVTTSSPSWSAASFLGVFSLGWNAFTTFHAVMLVGGFYHAFGPLALLLLLFYSIFWAIGIAMGWGAVRAATRESVVLEGRRMLLTHELLGWKRNREVALGPDSRADLVAASVQATSGSKSTPGTEVAIHDAEGQEVRLAMGRSLPDQKRLVERINEYLEGVRE